MKDEKIQAIADQLRASAFEHMRATIESDDVATLVAFLEGHGYVSAEAQAVIDAEASEESEAAEVPAKEAAKGKTK